MKRRFRKPKHTKQHIKKDCNSYFGEKFGKSWTWAQINATNVLVKFSIGYTRINLEISSLKKSWWRLKIVFDLPRNVIEYKVRNLKMQSKAYKAEIAVYWWTYCSSGVTVKGNSRMQHQKGRVTSTESICPRDFDIILKTLTNFFQFVINCFPWLPSWRQETLIIMFISLTNF